MFPLIGFSQTLTFYKLKDDEIKKEFVIEKNDIVKVKLKNGSTIKGRISNIQNEGFKLDTTQVYLNDVISLGMNTKERRQVGQILSSVVLGITVVTGVTWYIPSDPGVALGVLMISSISGLTSIYTLDLAYGQRKKFNLNDPKWEVRVSS